jgi:hypothetical protein
MKIIFALYLFFLLPYISFGDAVLDNAKKYEKLKGQKFEKVCSSFDFDNDGVNDKATFSLIFISSKDVWGRLEIKSKTTTIWLDVYKIRESGLKDPNLWSAEPKDFILNAEYVKNFVGEAFSKSMYAPTIHALSPNELQIDDRLLQKHHLCSPKCDVGLMNKGIKTSGKKINTIWYRNFDRESFNELAYSSYVKYMAVINQGDY